LLGEFSPTCVSLYKEFPSGLGIATLSNEDVGRFDVAVDDSL
jgi:hypothetical protein